MKEGNLIVVFHAGKNFWAQHLQTHSDDIKERKILLKGSTWSGSRVIQNLRQLKAYATVSKSCKLLFRHFSPSVLFSLIPFIISCPD